MTYQKLFRLLMFASILMLGAVWWQSGKTYFRAGYSPGPESHGISVTLYSRNVLFCHMPPGFPTTGLEYQTGPPGDVATSDEKGPPGPLGSFHFMQLPVVEPESFWNTIHEVQFPIWVPWLLFVVIAFVFCKLMERRSATRKEKKLAALQAADRLTVDPG